MKKSLPDSNLRVTKGCSKVRFFIIDREVYTVAFCSKVCVEKVALRFNVKIKVLPLKSKS